MIKSCVDSAADGPLDVTNLGWDRTPLQDVSTRACPLEFRDEGSFFDSPPDPCLLWPSQKRDGEVFSHRFLL